MFTKSAIQTFVLKLSDAFHGLGMSLEMETNDLPVSSDAKIEEKEAPKKERKKRTTKEKETTPVEVVEDDAEEVESPYTETISDEDDLAGMEEDETEEVEEKEATIEVLRTALMAYAQKHGKQKAYKVLGKYVKKPAGDSPKANEVKQSDIAKAIKDLKI